MDRNLSNDQLVKIIDDAIVNFQGNLNHLEAAIEMLMAGRKIGWKPLLLSSGDTV
jgi:hypothetical protein